jgi:hypothetical protein
VIDQVVPLVGDLRSGRSVRLLWAGIELIARAAGPPRLADAGAHLVEALWAAGYETHTHVTR